jgi:hypothetical protein
MHLVFTDELDFFLAGLAEAPCNVRLLAADYLGYM